MTTPATDPRPWSPSSPHIGPDDEDLAMLAQTGEVEDDLGSAVLTVHRVGAAAAEAVARQPLPDEYRLIEALASARADLAPRAVEAVAKCVSTEPYADLLLRDLFDDAERGALAVYTACVSKGVAPPLAVQRAGLSYGPPPEDLGRYIAVAANPASHPVAIADAADRAVIGWASGVVREELAETKINKRVSVAQWNVTQEGLEHPKGMDGRFVDAAQRASLPARPGPTVTDNPGLLARLRRQTGAGLQAAPQVGEPAVVAPPAEEKPPARQQRQERQQRQKRQRRMAPSQQATMGQARMNASMKGQQRALLKSRATARVSAAMEAQLEAQRDEPVDFDMTVNLRQRINDQNIYGMLPDQNLAWAMSPADAKAWYEMAGGKAIRIGWLTEVLENPEEWDQAAEGDLSRSQITHRMNVRHNAEDHRPTDEYDEQVRVHKITRAELERNGIVSDVGAVEMYARGEGYYDLVNTDDEGRSNPAGEVFTGVAPSAERDGDWFVIRRPIPKNFMAEQEAPMAHAAEYVMTTEPYFGARARGNVEGSPDNPHYIVDPNQAVLISRPKTLWSEAHRAWVDRYTVIPVDEDDLLKADVSVAEWNATAVGQEHPKDEAGRWTATPGLRARLAPRQAPVVTPEVTPLRTERQRRQVRQSRQVRRGATAPAARVQARIQAQAGARLSARQQTALKAGLQAPRPQVSRDQDILWDDQPRYKVFIAADWQQIADDAGYKGFADPGTLDRLSISGRAKRQILEREALAGAGVDAELRINVEQHVTEQHEGARRKAKVGGKTQRYIEGDDHEGWETFGHDIRKMMEEDPYVVSAVIEAVQEDEDGNGTYEVWVNRHRVPPQTVVVMPDDYDPDDRMVLRWVKTARQSELGELRMTDLSLHVDAPVHIYRLTRTNQEIWQAESE